MEEYTAGKRDDFLARRIVQDAVLRNLQVLAESSQRPSESLKVSRPEIDWRGISGFRNVLVHDYLGLNLDEVWNIVEKFLPDVKRYLSAIADQGEVKGMYRDARGTKGKGASVELPTETSAHHAATLTFLRADEIREELLRFGGLQGGVFGGTLPQPRP